MIQNYQGAYFNDFRDFLRFLHPFLQIWQMNSV
jgi:hypothetical protein